VISESVKVWSRVLRKVSSGLCGGGKERCRCPFWGRQIKGRSSHRPGAMVEENRRVLGKRKKRNALLGFRRPRLGGRVFWPEEGRGVHPFLSFWRRGGVGGQVVGQSVRSLFVGKKLGSWSLLRRKRKKGYWVHVREWGLGKR